MASIDERIVSLKFNADQFSNNVNKSLGLLDRLKQKLNLKGAGQGMAEVSGAINKVNFNPILSGLESARNGFSTLAIAAGTALGNIATTIASKVGSALNSLSFKPMKDGFAEYEQGLNSVQTILNNTKSKGESIQTVNAALKELNTYADQTIYSFSDMTKNASLFTAAGVGLKDSTSAIKGLSQFAAVAGVNSQEASRAMFQMSQAISSGTVKLQDWMSVENAGMGGEQFQNALKRTARAHGVHVDELIAKEGSFRASLSKGWLDSSIMLETLSQMAGEYNEEQLRTMGYTDEEIAQIQELAQTGLDAATKIKTFSQLVDVVKEEMGSGWAETWQILLGDFEEASQLWTTVGNAITGTLSGMSKARNQMLQGWKDLGGRTEVINALINTVKGIVPLFSAIGKAWQQVFPPMTAQTLLKMTHGFSTFIQKLVPSQGTIDKIARAFKGVFSILHIGVTIVKSVGVVFGKIFSAFGSGAGGVLSFSAKLGDLAVRLDQFLTGSGRLQRFIEGFGDIVSGIIRSIISFVSGVVKAIGDWAKSIHLVEGLKAAWEGFKDSMSGVKDAISKVLGVFTRYDQALTVAQKSGEGAKFVLEKLKAAFEGLLKAVRKVAPYIKSAFDKVFEVIGKIASGMSLDDILKSLLTVGGLGALKKFSDVMGGVQGIIEKFKQGGDDSPGLITRIKDAFSALTDSLKEMQSTLKVAQLMTIAVAIGILTACVYTISRIPASSLLKATGAISVMMGQLGASLAMFTSIVDTKSTTDIIKATAALVLIAFAIRVLSSAVEKLSKIEWKGLLKGLGATIALLAGITLAMKFMDSDNGSSLKAAAAMILIAFAIRMLVGAVERLGEIDWKKLLKGLGAVLVLLAAIVIAMKFAGTGSTIRGALAIVAIAFAIDMLVKPIKKLGETRWKELAKGLGSVVVILAAVAAFSHFSGGASSLLSAAGLFIIAMAIERISDVVIDLGKQNWKTLAKGLISMGVALAAVGAFMALVPPTGLLAAAGLVVAAYGLKVIGGVMEKWGKMSWSEIGKSMVMLGGTLLILAAGVTAMTFALPGAIALGVVAAALMGLYPVLMGFSKLSWGEIAKGLAMLAGTLAVFVIAGYAVTPVVLPLMGLAAAITMIGLAVALAGTGVFLFAAGLGTLVAVGTVGLDALKATLDALAESIPKFGTTLAEAFVNFTTTLANNVETIKANFVTIIGSMIDAGIELLPKFTELAITIINCLCEAAKTCIPNIIDTGWTIILAFLRAMRDHVGEATNIAIDIVLNFISAVRARLPEIVDAGWKLVIDFINAMTQALHDNGPALRKAIRELIKEFINQGKLALQEQVSEVKEKAKGIGQAIIDGTKNAINNGIQSVKDTASSMAQGALSAAKWALGIKSPSREFKKVGKHVVEGFIVGVNNNTHHAEKSTRTLAIKSIKSFQKAVEEQKLNEMVLARPQIKPVLNMKGVRKALSNTSGMFKAGVSLEGWRSFEERHRDLAGWGIRDGGGRLVTTYMLNEIMRKQLALEEEQKRVQKPTQIQFIQNNTSPKALSPTEIYRQTKNQLSMAKGVLER